MLCPKCRKYHNVDTWDDKLLSSRDWAFRCGDLHVQVRQWGVWKDPLPEKALRKALRHGLNEWSADQP